MREMQAIYRERVEANETGLEYTGTRMAALEGALETLTTKRQQTGYGLITGAPERTLISRPFPPGI